MEQVASPILLTINGKRVPDKAIKSYFVGARNDAPTIINVECDLTSIGPVEGIPDSPSEVAQPVSGPMKTAIVPRAFVGKELTELSSAHIEELKSLRQQRKVEIFDTVPDFIKQIEKKGEMTYVTEPVQVETKEYEVSTWDDMQTLIGKLVQNEVVVCKEYMAVVQDKAPVALSSGDSQKVVLSEKLIGYRVKE